MRWFLLLLLCSCTTTIIEKNSIDIHFCPKTDCGKIWAQEILESRKVICALYELKDPRIIDALKSRQHYIIIEDTNYKPFHKYLHGQKDNHMTTNHNKICVLDGKTVITGSFNPNNGNHLDNLIIIESNAVSKIYADAIHTISKSKRPKAGKNRITNSKTIMSIYFCPKDNCKQQIITAITKSQKQIDFMMFSITDEGVLNALKKAQKRGIKINGIIETTGAKRGIYPQLKKSKLNVSLYRGKGFLHHKVMIIDELIVFTGSMNPTQNGFFNNDENLLMIYNKELANKYLNELNRIKILNKIT